MPLNCSYLSVRSILNSLDCIKIFLDAEGNDLPIAEGKQKIKNMKEIDDTLLTTEEILKYELFTRLRASNNIYLDSPAGPNRIQDVTTSYIINRLTKQNSLCQEVPSILIPLETL